jgi:hypothetical protein
VRAGRNIVHVNVIGLVRILFDNAGWIDYVQWVGKRKGFDMTWADALARIERIRSLWQSATFDDQTFARKVGMVIDEYTADPKD